MTRKKKRPNETSHKYRRMITLFMRRFQLCDLCGRVNVCGMLLCTDCNGFLGAKSIKDKDQLKALVVAYEEKTQQRVQ